MYKNCTNHLHFVYEHLGQENWLMSIKIDKVKKLFKNDFQLNKNKFI